MSTVEPYFVPNNTLNTAGHLIDFDAWDSGQQPEEGRRERSELLKEIV